jgi:hypothetical protein
MAHRHPVASGPRGGERIPPKRASRARLITAAGAFAALAIAGLYAVAHASGRTEAVGPLAVAGCGVLLLGLALRRATAIPWAVLLTAAGYVTGREGSGGVDGGAAIVGALLLLAAELASWSVDDDRRIAMEPALTAHRVLVTAGVVASGLLIGFLLLGTAAVTTSTGLVVAVAGVAAAVTSVAIVLRLVRA